MKVRLQNRSTVRIASFLVLAAILFIAAFAVFERLLLTHSSQIVGGPVTAPQADPKSVTGWAASVLIFASVMALPISAGLLRLYRRAVVKAMHTSAHVEAQPPDSQTLSQQPGTSSPQIVIVDHVGAATIGVETHQLVKKLKLLPWMAAASYAAAGLSFGLATALCLLTAERFEILPIRLLIITWIYTWPAALAVSTVAALTRRARVAIPGTYFLVYLLLGYVELTRSPNFSWGQLLHLWLIYNLLPTVLVSIFSNRRIRAVGPLVLLLMAFAIFGGLSSPYLLFSSKALTRIAVDLFGGTLAFYVAEIVGFALFGTAGWLVLQYINRSYERRALSDQSILLGAVWLVFAMYWFVDLALEGYVWIASAVPAIVVFGVVLHSGFARLRVYSASSGVSRKLLVLRVFALGQQSERLYHSVSKYWRYVGSVAQIAGPDLLTATVQPHEFLDFMSGKLSRRFVDNSQTLQLRLSEADNKPSADARYRINDFFCYEDTWKVVLDRLVRDTDAVLMDLRGFDRRSAGCVFEIEQLVNVVPMQRVVFVVDNRTDQSFLQSTLINSWMRQTATSPNRLIRQIRLFRFTAPVDDRLPALFRLLAEAACSPSATLETMKDNGNASVGSRAYPVDYQARGTARV